MARGHHGDGFPIGDGLPELRHGEKKSQLIQQTQAYALRNPISALQQDSINNLYSSSVLRISHPNHW